MLKTKNFAENYGKVKWFTLAMVGSVHLLFASAANAATPAIDEITAQLQKMNDADCIAAKKQDYSVFASSLAPEYVSIGADGSRQGRYETLTDLKKMAPLFTVTACSTQVSKVIHVGNHYYLYGVYTEEGLDVAKNKTYRSRERIRDGWKRDGDHWLQIESVTMEQQVWGDGTINGTTSHLVLPLKSIPKPLR